MPGCSPQARNNLQAHPPGVASTPSGSAAVKGEDKSFFISTTSVMAEREEQATKQPPLWILFWLQYIFQRTCISPLYHHVHKCARK